MSKKVLVGFVLTFIISEIISTVEHMYVLSATYESLKDVWRADMMDKIWISYLISLSNSYFFSLIFSKGYENKGIMEGVRYGFYMGVLLGFGYGYGSYMSFNITLDLAHNWFLWSVGTYIICGIALAKYYERENKTAAQA